MTHETQPHSPQAANDNAAEALNAGLWTKVSLILVAAIMLITWALLKVSLEGNLNTVVFPVDNALDATDFTPGEEVDAQETVYFNQRGRHTLFVEYERSVEDQGLVTPFAAQELQVQIIRLADMRAIPLSSTDAQEYRIGRNVGRAHYQADIPARGEYLVNLVVPLQEPVGEITLSFQKDARARYARAGIIILLTLLGSSGIVWVLIRRGHPQPGHLG